MIGSLTHIDYKVKIGENTRIEGSVYIPPLTTIGKNVFISPGATFTNDPYPMSPKMAGVVVDDGVIIGSRAVIKAGVRI
jgi:UDP-2-acetamido-3-amino-2,3-dideoxy-glucuronate N-acetyltransferase